MTQGHDRQPFKAAEDFIARVRTWWQHGNELKDMDRHEVDRIAADLGMTARDLEELAARGPDAAELLHRRLTALGLSRSDVERTALGLMRDLERTCSLLRSARASASRTSPTGRTDPAWKSYCPNAISLESVAGTKGRFPA